MHYSVQKSPTLPAVIVEAYEGYTWSEQPALHAQVMEYLEASPVPLFYLVDISRTTLDFDTVLLSANSGARNLGSAWKHPKIRQMIFVSTDLLLQRAVAGLNTEAFGFLDAKTFETLADAEAYIKAQS